MKKIIRNIGYVHHLKPEETRSYVTSVDYAARTYTFPAEKETVVEGDVADYVSSIHAGHGLVIVDRKLEVAEHLSSRLAEARAKLPAPAPGPAIPALRRGGVERPKPIAGTEAIRLAREAAVKAAAAIPAAAPAPKVGSPAIAQAAGLQAKLAEARAKGAAAPASPTAAASRSAKIADTKARIAQAKAKKK